MGRIKDNRIWNHYRQTENKTAICKYCDKLYKFANLQKMRNHLIKCLMCPEHYKQIILQSKSSENLSNNTNSVLQSLANKENTFQCNEIPGSSNTEVTISSTSRFSDEMRRDMSDLICKAIYVTGTPLSMVDHPLWKQVFEKLQPAYKLPSRKAVSTTQLDKIYKNMQQGINEDIKSQNPLHLQLDGWSNTRNDGIINILIAKPEPVLVKGIETAENRHTSEYLCDKICDILIEYGPEKFSTLIGDNAKNIQKAFKLVKEKYPHVTYFNCTAHTLHLLCKDVFKIESLAASKNMAVDIIKTIKHSQVLSALLAKIVKEKGVGESLKLPCNTRWGSHCASFKSLENTKIALQTLAVHEKATLLQTEDKSTLLDDRFWLMISECVKILKPISDLIFQLETNEQNIHKVFLGLKDMNSKLQFCLPDILTLDDEDKQVILAATESRVDMCLKPIHYAAYLLDPASQGVELNEVQESKAVEFIIETGQNLGIEVLPNLASYKAKDGLWNKRFLWQNVDDIKPLVWWKGLCGSSLLSKVAVRILTAPCTSAAVERSFSTESNIHNKKRNRLTSERAAKLTYISYNWNLLYKYVENENENDASPQSLEVSDLRDSVSVMSDPQPSTSSAEIEFLDCDNLPN